jgi:hypothetical protein
MEKSKVIILRGVPKENIYINLYTSDAVSESVILTGGKKVTIVIVDENE